MSNNATSTPEPGQLLAGKYVIEEVLGIGGMGVVVSAKHVALDQKVAIKYLLPAALLNPEVVERFAREARAAAKIRGEHVARVIDVGQFDDGAPYMVMEHLQGKDLAKVLELSGALPIEDTIRYLLETCEALAEAHAAKIVHRDLKPSNLFLSRQPDKSDIIKVLDFGISKTGDAPSASLTKTSALMGTAFYMSPEQLTNPKGVDHRSDIWALGVILYELLSGRPPFMGESVPEIIGGILSNQPDSIRTLRADIPLGLEAVIVKCMQTKPADRYQSVAALAAAMGAYANARDRQSIETTARVLGESLRPQAEPSSPVGKATVLASTGPQQTSPGRASDPGTDPALHSKEVQSQLTILPSKTPQLVDTGTAPAVAAVTTHGLSTSTITTKPKRMPMGLIGAAVVLVMAVAGLAFGGKLLGKSDTPTPPAAATGLVAAPPADPLPAATAAKPTTILPATAAAVEPPPPASAAATTAAAARPTAVQHAGVAVAPVAPVKSAAPVASAPVAPVASATPPAATAVAAPPSSASKNPLQMGIK
jgi:serine/threonine-protein kinase